MVALGIFGLQKGEGIDANFDTFLHQPFHPLSIFSGGNGQMKMIGAGAGPLGQCHDLDGATPKIGLLDQGFSHPAPAIGKKNRIALAHAHHLDTVARFLFG